MNTLEQKHNTTVSTAILRFRCQNKKKIDCFTFFSFSSLLLHIMENILSDILESEASLCHITSIVSDEKLFQPLFSLNTKRKRNAQEFLDDYNKKHGTIVIDNDEPPEYQHSPELKLALRNLSFKIDPFFQKRLKLHQVIFVFVFLSVFFF